MKAFLDHFAYHWLPHRPIPEMFEKRAVIITQCLGAGAKSAAKDIKHSLSWWGVSKIGIFTGALMSDIVWENQTVEIIDGKSNPNGYLYNKSTLLRSVAFVKMSVSCNELL